MTDNSGAQPNDASVPPVPPAPAAPYDSAPYVPPAAPSYDTAGYPQASDQPLYAPPSYAPPTQPTSPYGSAPTGPYGAAQAAPYGGQYGAPAAAPYGYGGYAARKTNSLAVASMVASIAGVVFSWTWVLSLGVIAGVIMGHIALGQIKRTGEAGRGMALAGVIIGWVSIGIGVLLIALAVVFWGFYGVGYMRSGYGA